MSRIPRPTKRVRSFAPGKLMFITSSRLHPERQAAIRSIVLDFFLPQVIKRCQDKFSHILVGPYSKAFRDWLVDITNSNPLEGGDGSFDPVVLQCSELINRCSSERIPKRRNADDASALVRAISNASIIIDGFAVSLEEQWAIYDSQISRDLVAVGALETDEKDLQGEQVDGEYLDDRESLDQIEMARSSIHRFLQKRSRYYVACRIITSELVALIHSGAEPNITVAKDD
jgi:hypothetical protein